MSTLPPQEICFSDQPRVSCDGDEAGVAGHPLVYLQIDARGFVDCGYCDRRFILSGGPAETRPGVVRAVGGDHH